MIGLRKQHLKNKHYYNTIQIQKHSNILEMFFMANALVQVSVSEKLKGITDMLLEKVHQEIQAACQDR